MTKTFGKGKETDIRIGRGRHNRHSNAVVMNEAPTPVCWVAMGEQAGARLQAGFFRRMSIFCGGGAPIVPSSSGGRKKYGGLLFLVMAFDTASISATVTHRARQMLKVSFLVTIIQCSLRSNHIY